MRKIFQERISNSELKKNKSGFFYPKCLEIWNRNSSKTFNETLKRIIGYDKDIRVSFLSDTMFTVLADKKYQGVIEYEKQTIIDVWRHKSRCHTTKRYSLLRRRRNELVHPRFCAKSTA